MTEYRDLTVSDNSYTICPEILTLFPFQIILLQGNRLQGSFQGSLQGSGLIHFQSKQTLQQLMQMLQQNSKCIRTTTGLSSPTDTQALTALQNLISDDFQVKNTHSTQRKGEETPDTRSIQRMGENETFQLIQKIHNQLQEVQWDLQRLHSLHKYKN